MMITGLQSYLERAEKRRCIEADRLMQRGQQTQQDYEQSAQAFFAEMLREKRLIEKRLRKQQLQLS